MSKQCYIFAAGDLLADVRIPNDSFTIAADAGYSNALKVGVTPSLLIGDFDSIESFPSDIETVKYPPEKDYTDTELAINVAIERGFTDFTVLGALGGERFEHTVANLQLACGIAKKGFNITLSDGITYIRALHCSDTTFDSTHTGYISVFSFDGEANGVTLKNLKYELDNVTLPCTGTLGVSNEFIGKQAYVSVKRGTLLIIYRRKDNTSHEN